MSRLSGPIGVFSFGRTQSQRCPNKMLRPFAGTTLTDIMLQKLARCGAPSFFAGDGEAFEAKCRRHGVPFVARDPRSANIDEPIIQILSFLRDVEFEHLLIVNGCLPLLKTETIASFLRDCLAHGRQPAFAVIKRQNHFFSLERRALNFDASSKTINTKAVTPVYEFAHALYFFNREYFLSHGTYWDWRTVRLVELPGGIELVDIHTEDDFRLAERLWTALGAEAIPNLAEEAA